jgi:hypothetical protein
MVYKNHQISRTTYVNFQTFVFLGYIISRNLNTARMISELYHAHMCSSLVVGTLDGCCETSDIAKTTPRYTQTVKVWTAESKGGAGRCDMAGKCAMPNLTGKYVSILCLFCTNRRRNLLKLECSYRPICSSMITHNNLPFLRVCIIHFHHNIF